MIKYDTVVRIGLNSKIFYNEVSSDLTEWWTDYNGLLDNPYIYNLLNIYHSEELEALKNKEIDYIVLSSEL